MMILILSVLSSASEACVIAAASDASVQCLSEDAVMIWDAHSKTQELVRTITFQSHAVDFAFLTATPSPPAIRQVDQDLFLRAHTLTKPKENRHVQNKIRWSWFFHESDDRQTPQEKKSASASGILAEVEPFVFPSSQSKRLESWFHENGYVYTPTLKKWVSGTFEKNWSIIASRIEKPKSATGKSRVRSRSLQMSFQSAQPVYPYREPILPIPSDSSRSLRLYVISKAQLHGALDGKPWRGKMAYSNIQSDLQTQLGSFFTYEEDVPKLAWLTLFTDRSGSRSQKDDLRFMPTITPKSISRESETVDETNWITIPLDLIFSLLIGLLAIFRLRRGQ